MSPLLGIWGAQGGSYDSLQTISVTSATQANVEFTNIPQNYTHLQIRCIVRGDTNTSAPIGFRMRVNGDTGNNYANHFLYGDGSTVVDSGNATSTNEWQAGNAAGGTSASNTFSSIVHDILDYANTNKYKTRRTLSGLSVNTSTTDSLVVLSSGLWISTSAITSIRLYVNSSNLVQNSHFALYGIRTK